MEHKDNKQLALDFDSASKADGEHLGSGRGARIYNLVFSLRGKSTARPAKVEDVDSVLEEVLSEAKKLNW